METVFILVIVIVLIVILSRRFGTTEESLQRLNEQTLRLTDEVRELRKALNEPSTVPASPTIPPKPATPPQQSIPPQPAPVPKPAPLSPAPPAPSPEPAPASKREQLVPQAAPTLPVEAERKPFFQRFLAENPDLEKFIGENLVNKIGIAILVLGIGFFVKYAIDQNWINEAGRVAIGAACGVILTGLAHYLRRSYRAFSSVLAGGGIATFYSTIAFAYQQYGLIPQTPSFLLLVVITGFAVALALLYDSLALAIIATVGGFATPFLVSNGSGNYVVLLSYLGVLNAGILALTFFKRWPSLNAIALGFTLLIVGGWIYTAVGADKPNVNWLLAFTLVTALYGIFLGMNMAFPVRFGRAFRAYDLSLLLLITAAYYGAGLLLLRAYAGDRYEGLFTIASGAVNLALAFYCFRRRGTDRNLLYLLVGLTLTFATLSIPMQLHGHAITLFWSAEFVLLYWLYQRSGMRIFRLGSWLLMVLAVTSLGMDWLFCRDTDGGLTVLFDDWAGAATNVVAALSFALYHYLLRRETPRSESTHSTDPKTGELALRWLTGCATVAIIYLSLLTAVNLYFYKFSGVAVPNVYHRIITALAAIGLGAWLLRRGTAMAAWLQLAFAGGALLYYLGSQEAIGALRTGISAGHYPSIHFGMHVVATLLYCALFVRCALLAARHHALAEIRRGLAWALTVAIVLFLSLDAGHIYTMWGGGSNLLLRQEQYGRAMLTILWGLCSFALMWLGMRHRVRTLRVISLSLFLLALLKLFFFDLANISEGGKIVAFILLGALLLTVSFMYQKLKKILIDDRPA